jgi:cystathionine gamma-synthase
MSKDTSTQTRAVRAAVDTDAQHGAVMPPVYLSSNFAFRGFGQPGQYDYTRTANPTRDALAAALTELEGGAGTTVTASGMAAIHLVCQLLNPGDRVVGPRYCYGGTFRLFTQCAKRGLFEVELIDQADGAALAAALSRSPRLLWVESPTNPLLRVIDLATVSAQARAAGALVAVDNTFLSPALQRPLALGADLVVHSTTKYLNGHSDMVGGAVTAATTELAERMAYWGNALGLTGSPFDSFLTLRGLRTLFARMRQHEENAVALAECLAAHPAVARVHYPGLPSHPDHALAKRQQAGFGGMLSFELVNGEAGARALLQTVALYTLAESLGGVESLICHPASMSHATFDAASLSAAGIGPGLLRISAGIESPADLVADLRRGLDAAA